jgi:hypothetical protein
MSTHTAEQVEAGSALCAAAKTEVESLPDDWRTAKFTVEIERGEKGPLISVGHKITGETFQSSGELCDCELLWGED